jgi:hypothetical protein
MPEQYNDRGIPSSGALLRSMPESPESTDDLLELEVVSLYGGLDAEGFISVFRHAVDMLEQIVRNISEFGSDDEVQWQIVYASMASPFTTTLNGAARGKTRGRLGPDAVKHAIKGIHSLEDGVVVPYGFNAKALDDVADLLQGAPRGIAGVTLRRVDRQRRVKESAPITKTIASNARAAKRLLDLERAKRSGEYVDYGTLEGTLRDLLGTSTNKLVLVDDLTGKTTNCTFRGEENDIKARKAWKSRVAVTGDITYDRASGLPTSVHVDEIRLLNPNPPQLEDFAGIDITGGMDSADFIRGLRDDD